MKLLANFFFLNLSFCRACSPTFWFHCTTTLLAEMTVSNYSEEYPIVHKAIANALEQTSSYSCYDIVIGTITILWFVAKQPKLDHKC